MNSLPEPLTPTARRRTGTVARGTQSDYHNLIIHTPRQARVQTLPPPKVINPLSQHLELSEDQQSDSSDSSSKTNQNTLEQEHERSPEEIEQEKLEESLKAQEAKEQEEREQAITRANILLAAGLHQHALKFCKGQEFLFRQACDARNLLIHDCFPSPDDSATVCQDLITRGRRHCQDQLEFLSTILGVDEIKETTNPHTFPLPSCDAKGTTVQISVEEKHLTAFKKIACARARLDRRDIGYLLRLCADTWRYLGTRFDSPASEHYPNWVQTANFFYCAARYNLVDVDENTEITELDFVEFAGSGTRKQLFDREIAEEYTGLVLNYANFLLWMPRGRVLNAALVIAKKAERLIAEYLDKVPEEVYPKVRINYLGLRDVKLGIQSKIDAKPGPKQ